MPSATWRAVQPGGVDAVRPQARVGKVGDASPKGIQAGIGANAAPQLRRRRRAFAQVVGKARSDAPETAGRR